ALGHTRACAPVRIGRIHLDVGVMAVAWTLVVIGCQLVAFAFFTKVFAISEGLLPQDSKFSSIFKFFTLERGICVGFLILAAGVGLVFRAAWIWQQIGYGTLPYDDNMRRLIPAVTMIAISIQVIFSSFFMSVLG